MLCELETDKVSVEVPAPASGTLAEIYAEDGATVQAGGKLGRIAGGSAAAGRPRRPSPPPAGRRRGRPGPGGKRDVENAPSANKLMADRGLAPDQVEGTGRDGRIMKEDVLRAEAPAAPAPAPAPEPVADPALAGRRPRTPPARSG